VLNIIWSSPSKIIRLQREAFKLKKFLIPQQVQNLGIDDSLSSTMFYMAYYSMISRWQLPSEGMHLDYTKMQSYEHYIANLTMESCFAAFRTKRHRKPWGKVTIGCAALANPNPNLEIDSKDLATTDQRWFLMLSYMLSGVTPVRSSMTSSTKHQDIFTQRLLHDHLRCGE